MREQSFEKRRRPWLRWLKRAGWGLLTLLVIAICAWTWWHYSAQKRLEEALAELDHAEPGWRLEVIEAAREQIPEEENSARVVAVAAKLLPEKWLSQDLDTLLSTVESAERLPADASLQLTESLDKVRPAVEEARKLADLRRGRYPITYKPDVLVSTLPHREQMKAVLILLRGDIFRHDQNGDMGAALKSCRSILNAARSIGDEPLALSQLARYGGLLIACRSLERSLGQGETPPEELSAARRLLEQEDAFSELPLIARGERAVIQETFAAIENSNATLADLAGSRLSWYGQTIAPITRDLLRSEHPLMLEMMSRWINVARLPSPEQAKAEQQLSFDFRYKARYTLLTRLLVPSFMAVGQASRRKHAVMRCALVGLAVENYRQVHKRWPASLDKLGPDFLAIVPFDPYDGQPLRYRRLDDGVVVYAVGDDGVDNGGNIDRKQYESDADVGFRLWDVAKRRQPARPKPLLNLE